MRPPPTIDFVEVNLIASAKQNQLGCVRDPTTLSNGAYDPIESLGKSLASNSRGSDERTLAVAPTKRVC